MYKVEKVNYDKLPSEFKEEFSYEGEYHQYFIINNDGLLSVYSDRMEPEDATFYRDLAWIRTELIAAYEQGKIDGRLET